MKEIWFRGQKDREKVKRDFAVSGPAFKVLEDILRTKLLTLQDMKQYDLAGWPYFRADADGYNRALTEVLELIKED